jgi:hypothetical protein
MIGGVLVGAFGVFFELASIPLRWLLGELAFGFFSALLL